jgi:sRNA-binding carbon storage regulator CsrA
MLHLVVDINDSVQIGDKIVVIFHKKTGRKCFISIDAPSAMPIKMHKKAKEENHAKNETRNSQD